MAKEIVRPPGGWRDAKVLGKKLKAIRVGRGLTRKKAASELGVDIAYYGKLEVGSFLPPRWCQERIYRWAVKGERFHLRQPRGHSQVAKAEGFVAVKVRLPPTLASKVRLLAVRLNMTQEELLLLALERMLGDPGELTTYQLAMKRLEKVKVAQALAENPSLRLFLESELELCVDMGATLIEGEVKREDKPIKLDEAINLDEMDFSEWELK